MTSPKQPILIFELGHLQVFCYQTIEEWTHKMPPTEVFWQKKGEPATHGPFTSAYHAVSNYSAHMTTEKLAAAPTPDNVIHVDFKTKKRIK